jgi:hypothetical protein
MCIVNVVIAEATEDASRTGEQSTPSSAAGRGQNDGEGGLSAVEQLEAVLAG